MAMMMIVFPEIQNGACVYSSIIGYWRLRFGVWWVVDILNSADKASGTDTH